MQIHHSQQPGQQQQQTAQQLHHHQQQSIQKGKKKIPRTYQFQQNFNKQSRGHHGAGSV